MRHHLTLARLAIIKSLQIINAGEDMEKREPSYIVNGDVSWYSYYGKQYRGSLKKLKIELPYDPAIPLLGIYLEKNMVWMDACTPVFMEAWFTMAKTRKQPKCPLTEERIKKMSYIYKTEYYSNIKKNEIMPFSVAWMDLQSVILHEVRQRRKNTIGCPLYVESKKQYKSTCL